MKSMGVVLVFILLTSFSPKEDDTCKVILSRHSIYSGTAGPIKVFMDGKILCEISNNSFSTHSLPVGKHKFSAQWNGKESKEGAEDRSLDVEFVNDRTYYLNLVKMNKGLLTYINVEEVTESSFNRTKEMKKLKEEDCH